MSGSSEADAKGGQGSVGVAAVIPEPGGEVDRPGAAQHADDQVAQGRHDLGRGPGAHPGGVFCERGVAEVVQGLDLSSRLRLWDVTVEGFGEAGVDAGGAACQDLTVLT